MYVDPMTTLLLHRVETEQAMTKAEQHRAIAEHAAAEEPARRVRSARSRMPIRSVFRKTVETGEA